MIRRGCPTVRTSNYSRPKMTRVVPPTPSRLVPATSPRRVMSSSPSLTPNATPLPQEGVTCQKGEPKPSVNDQVKPDRLMYCFRVGIMSTATLGGLVVAGPFGGLVGLGLSSLILDASK